MKAKLSKQKKSLLRVIIASVVFAALFITEHTVKPEWYVSLPLFLALYLFIGWDIAYKAFKGVIGGQMMDENLLMFIATVGAFIVGEYPEAAAVMLFYQIGELFQSYAVGKSRSSIAALMDIRPDTATVVRNGEERTVAPEEVETGEIIVVRPGEKIPVDGIRLRLRENPFRRTLRPVPLCFQARSMKAERLKYGATRRIAILRWQGYWILWKTLLPKKPRRKALLLNLRRFIPPSWSFWPSCLR